MGVVAGEGLGADSTRAAPTLAAVTHAIASSCSGVSHSLSKTAAARAAAAGSRLIKIAEHPGGRVRSATISRLWGPSNSAGLSVPPTPADEARAAARRQACDRGIKPQLVGCPIEGLHSCQEVADACHFGVKDREQLAHCDRPTLDRSTELIAGSRKLLNAPATRRCGELGLMQSPLRHDRTEDRDPSLRPCRLGRHRQRSIVPAGMPVGLGWS